MISEHVKRFLSMLIESLIAPAMRLARLAAVRHEVEAYASAVEEARALEQGGNAKLAQHLLSEMDEILNGTSFPAAGPALNGDRRPFAALEAPRAAGEPGPSEQQSSSDPEGESPPPRRRGRRPGSKNRPPEAVENAGAIETPPEQPQPVGETTWPADV
jgi:hypothetical protein